jgi:Kef-type K+ transport system membrane component KefB
MRLALLVTGSRMARRTHRQSTIAAVVLVTTTLAATLLSRGFLTLLWTPDIVLALLVGLTATGLLSRLVLILSRLIARRILAGTRLITFLALLARLCAT